MTSHCHVVLSKFFQESLESHRVKSLQVSLGSAGPLSSRSVCEVGTMERGSSGRPGGSSLVHDWLGCEVLGHTATTSPRKIGLPNEGGHRFQIHALTRTLPRDHPMSSMPLLWDLTFEPQLPHFHNRVLLYRLSKCESVYLKLLSVFKVMDEQIFLD